MAVKRSSYIILTVVFIYLLWINFQMPLMADDYRYAQNWEQTHHLENWSEIASFQINHYMEWGGRSLAHTLAQVMLFLDKPIFNIINSLAYISFIICMYYHVKGQVMKRLEPMLLMSVVFLAWFCFPTFGETSIWLLGSCNYLWMTTIVLWFLLPYRLAMTKIFAGQIYTSSPIWELFMFCGGIFAGWTNENTGLMMLLSVGLVNLYCWRTRQLQKWMVLGMVGAVIGYGLLVFAPGNYVRMESAETSEYSFVQNNIIDGLKTMNTLFLHQLPVYFTGFAIVRRIIRHKKVISLHEWREWGRANREILWSSAAYILLSYVALIVMFASPTFPQRAGMGAAVFLLIGVLQLLRLDVCKGFILFRRKAFVSAVMIGLWLASAVWAAHGYQTVRAEHELRMAAIEAAKAQGVKDMRVLPFSVKDRSAFGLVVVNDIGTDPKKFRSVYYARYFGFETMARSK